MEVEDELAVGEGPLDDEEPWTDGGLGPQEGAERRGAVVALLSRGQLPQPAEEARVGSPAEDDRAVMASQSHGQLEPAAWDHPSRSGELVDPAGGERLTVPSHRAPGALGSRGQADGRAQLHEGLVEIARPRTLDEHRRQPPEQRLPGAIARPPLDEEEPGKDAGHVAVDQGSRFPEGDGGDRTGGVAAEARQREEPLERRGQAAVVLFDDEPRARMEVPGPRVVAEASPQREDVAEIDRSQGLDGGQAGEEALVEWNDAVDLSLLQHHFADPHGVGVARTPPRKGASALVEPAEQSRAEPSLEGLGCDLFGGGAGLGEGAAHGGGFSHERLPLVFGRRHEDSVGRWAPKGLRGPGVNVMDDAPLKSLILSLNDSLMLLAPRGWSQIDLKVVETRGRLWLSELGTKGEGAAQPKPRAPFFIEPKDEAAHLSDGLTELKRRLGDRWTPGHVVVERKADFVDWKLLSPDGKVAWFTRLSAAELEALLVTEALLDMVTGTFGAFETLEAQLGERLGTVRSFAFDSETLALRLDRPQGPLALSAQLVGAYLGEGFTWVWSWSDEAAPLGAVEHVRRVCAPKAQPAGLSALWRPSYHCDEGFAWTVAGSVAVSVGSRGLFRGPLPDGSGAAFFAVMELP